MLFVFYMIVFYFRFGRVLKIISISDSFNTQPGFTSMNKYLLTLELSILVLAISASAFEGKYQSSFSCHCYRAL